MRVYLAGPIFQQSDAIAKDWRAHFTACDDFEWVDPMARDFRGKEDECYAEIVGGDIADIESVDVLVAKVVPASAGTSMEIYFAAEECALPVIVIAQGRVSPWVRYYARAIVADETAALALLQEWRE